MIVKQTRGYRTGLWAVAVSSMVLGMAVAGCGGPTASVSGKVLYKGKPVSGGDISFSPIADGAKEPGKPAAATVRPDGTYYLGTYRSSDGAVIGKHRVTYIPPVMPFPEGKTPRPGESPPRSGYEGLVPKQFEVEVKAGGGTIDIELVAPRRG